MQGDANDPEGLQVSETLPIASAEGVNLQSCERRKRVDPVGKVHSSACSRLQIRPWGI